MSKPISLPFVKNKDVEALLLWRDPIKSGAVLAGITAVYIILQWSHISLLTITANTLLVTVIVAFLWNNVASFTNRSGVPIPMVLKNGISEADAKTFAVRATDGVNRTLAYACRLASGKEVFLSLQAAAALFVIAKFGNWFTTIGLLYTVALLAFSVPKIYEVKKDQIDAVATKVHYHGKEAYVKYADPYVKKIPRASTSSGPPTSTSGNTVQDAVSDVVNGVEKKAQ